MVGMIGRESNALPPFRERHNFQRRFEPSGNVVLHGAGQDPGLGNRYDPGPFRIYWQAMDVESRPCIHELCPSQGRYVHIFSRVTGGTV
jgi:hypothetical protein